jgi:hypothetical protein
MRLTTQSKLIKHAINMRVNLGHDVVTIDEVMSDLASSHISVRDQYIRTFKNHAKSINYTFISDRLVRSNKFVGIHNV